MQCLSSHSRGVVLKVVIQPRSSKNMIVGLYGDRLKIKVTAPPVEGEANKRCIQFLAKCLSVPRSTLEIISGHNSRNKKILFKFEPSPPSAETSADLKQQIKRLITLHL